MNEAFRKSPKLLDPSQTGLQSFIKSVKKQLIILELLMNNIPTPESIRDKSLFRYKRIVKMVSNGNKIEFENFIKKYKETFV